MQSVTAMIWTAACIGRGNPLAACDAAVQENARCGSVSLVADAVAHQTLAAFTSGAQVRGQSAPHFSASTTSPEGRSLLVVNSVVFVH